MKKTLYFLLIGAIALTMTACVKKEEKQEENEIYTEQNVNFLEKYIANLPDNKSRKAFEILWNDVEMTGHLLERKMNGNTEKYEFDPSGEIPTQIAEAMDFSSLLSNMTFKNHKDWKITIDGENVYIEFDGIQFYPSEYGIMDVKEYIEKYNTEADELED